jgi:two-component system response regulator FixJ
MSERDEIFVLDDDPSLGGLLTHVVHGDGYRVSCFKYEEALVRAARARIPACILLDLFPQQRSGLEVLRDFDARAYAAPIIVMSGRANIPLAVEAIKLGAFDVIEKPVDPDAFPARLRETIAAWRRNAERNPADFPGSGRLTPRERQVLSASLRKYLQDENGTEALRKGFVCRAKMDAAVLPKSVSNRRSRCSVSAISLMVLPAWAACLASIL